MKSLPIRIKKKVSDQFQILVATNLRLSNFQLKSRLQFYSDYYQFLESQIPSVITEKNDHFFKLLGINAKILQGNLALPEIKLDGH